MIEATNPQLPKYVVEVITSPKTRPIPPLKMEKKLVNDIGKPLNTSNNLALKTSYICE
jgi:hypothetical protein